jgi:hypothetical protein
MQPKFTEDAKRLLLDNLRETWQKAIAFVLLALAVFPVIGVTLKESLPFAEKVQYICGIVGTVLLIYLLYFLVFSLRRAYGLVPADRSLHSHLADTLAALIGLRKTELSISSVVARDGSSVTTYDIRLLSKTKGITQVEYVSSAPSLPDGCDPLTPELVAGQASGVTMNVQVLRRTDRECIWAVNFSPALAVGREIRYRHLVRSPAKTFAVTFKEMQSYRLPCESYATMIAYPTDQLRIRVTFDGGLKPTKVQHDVWYGRGRVRHMAEYARIIEIGAFTNSQDEDGKLYGELVMPYPIHGLRYVITWEPESA